MDPLCLLFVSWACVGEAQTYLTKTNSSSPASLLYSGNVLTLLPLSVLLNALPRDRLCLLPFPFPFPAPFVVVPDVPFDRLLLPVPARSSAVRETREAA
jgi:hypothetical protein